jgi:putative ABC transport system permease protein
VDPEAAGRAIEALPLTTKVTAQPERAMLAAALDQLSDLVAASRGVVAVVLAVILIAMGNAISMATRDRAREFGILRTLGFRSGAVMALVMSEALVQALAGGLLGCALVDILVSQQVFQTISQCGIPINLTVGYEPWVAGLAAIGLAGVLGAVVPAWRAGRLNVVQALGRED